MRIGRLTLKRAAAALTAAALSLAVGPTLAAEYWLRAAPTSIDLPHPSGSGTVSVPMWGYASCTDGSYGTGVGQSCTAVTVPGPPLTVGATDTAGLTVHLRNDLAAPTSLVIHGLYKTMAPVLFEPASPATTYSSRPAGNTTARVRSFDAEANPNGGTADYTWSNVKPGTYLYQSGTQPQVQVQMGLYGALAKNAVDATTTPAEVYPGVAYDNQATLLYSEIDPALHAAVAADDYGPGKTVTSTFNYAPKYFLVNGAPYPAASLVIAPAGNPGTTLLRFLNAGLTTHVPMIQGANWTVVAEDGKPYPWRHRQYTALLPAAKTMDVLFTPDIGGGTYAVIDRRLSLSNAGVADGGMLAFLQYGAIGSSGADGTAGGNVAPVAVDDGYGSVVGAALSVGAAEGVLANDNNTDGLPLPIRAVAASGSTGAGGTYALNANGSFTYTPPTATFTGADSFTYQITDGKALAAAPATVTIDVATPAAPALTTLDDFNRGTAGTLGTDWSQTANTVTSAPDLQIVSDQASAVTTSSGGLAIWNAATFGATQGAGLASATPLANSALVLKATGGTDAAPANYIRVRCEGNEVVVATMMGGSNVSVFVKQAAFAAPGCSGSGSLSAAVDAKGLVTAFLNGTFVGGVQLADVPAWKGGGRIGIQLQTTGATVDGFSGGSL